MITDLARAGQRGVLIGTIKGELGSIAGTIQCQPSNAWRLGRALKLSIRYGANNLDESAHLDRRRPIR